MDALFRSIERFPAYRVSDSGEVQSRWNRRGRRCEMTGTCLPLKLSRRRHGHFVVHLYENGRNSAHYVPWHAKHKGVKFLLL